MKRAALILLAFAALSACKKDDLPEGTPSCIEGRVEAIKEQQPQSPPMRVIQYEYQGQTVYYIPASDACCDQLSELWDKQCNLLCHPDEGLLPTAATDSCPDFDNLKTAGKIIWEDERESD